MDWLLFAFALELGTIRGPEIPVDVASYVQMETTAIALRHLEIEGRLRTYQVPFKGYEWTPFLIDYSVSATVRFGQFSFGVEHLCYHPVGTSEILNVDAGGYERAFIRITTAPEYRTR